MLPTNRCFLRFSLYTCSTRVFVELALLSVRCTRHDDLSSEAFVTVVSGIKDFITLKDECSKCIVCEACCKRMMLEAKFIIRLNNLYSRTMLSRVDVD